MAHSQWLKPDEDRSFNTMGGGLNRSEADFLNWLSRSVACPGMVGVDAGCFTGWTGSQVWDTFKEHNGYFYMIDWFRGGVGSTIANYYCLEDDGFPNSPPYPAAEVLIQLLKNIEIKDMREHVGVLVSTTWRMPEIIADKSLSYVYLGGDHRYTPFMRDIAAWWPKLKDDGVLCGHALEGWPVSPESDLWFELCAEPEADYYGVGCHFGINRGLYEVFLDKDYAVVQAGNCWGVYKDKKVRGDWALTWEKE